MNNASRTHFPKPLRVNPLAAAIRDALRAERLRHQAEQSALRRAWDAMPSGVSVG